MLFARSWGSCPEPVARARAAQVPHDCIQPHGPGMADGAGSLALSARITATIQGPGSRNAPAASAMEAPWGCAASLRRKRASACAMVGPWAERQQAQKPEAPRCDQCRTGPSVPVFAGFGRFQC